MHGMGKGSAFPISSIELRVSLSWKQRQQIILSCSAFPSMELRGHSCRYKLFLFQQSRKSRKKEIEKSDCLHLITSIFSWSLVYDSLLPVSKTKKEHKEEMSPTFLLFCFSHSDSQSPQLGIKALSHSESSG